MKQKAFPVREDATRPEMGFPDRCYQCKRLLGEEHEAGCVYRKRTVVVELRVPIVVELPEDWDEGAINFYYDGSSSCKNNILRDLEKTEERLDAEKRCFCFLAKIKYLREATEKDHDTYACALRKKLLDLSLVGG